MSVESKKTIFNNILESAPLLLLFISVLNEFDFNYLNYKYFSFNLLLELKKKREFRVWFYFYCWTIQ